MKPLTAVFASLFALLAVTDSGRLDAQSIWDPYMQTRCVKEYQPGYPTLDATACGGTSHFWLVATADLNQRVNAGGALTYESHVPPTFVGRLNVDTVSHPYSDFLWLAFQDNPYAGGSSNYWQRTFDQDWTFSGAVNYSDWSPYPNGMSRGGIQLNADDGAGNWWEVAIDCNSLNWAGVDPDPKYVAVFPKETWGHYYIPIHGEAWGFGCPKNVDTYLTVNITQLFKLIVADLQYRDAHWAPPTDPHWNGHPNPKRWSDAFPTPPNGWGSLRLTGWGVQVETFQGAIGNIWYADLNVY